MAKKEKEAKTKTEKSEAPEFKYGVADIAEKLELEPASVRVKLRNAGIEKAGKSYGWNTKAELQEVIDELGAEKPAKKSKKSKGDEDEAPKKAKKEKGAKAKKGKSSKKSKDEDEDEEDDD